MGNIKKPSVSPNTNGLTSSSHSEKALYPISDCSTSSSFCQSFSECEELNKKFQPKKEKSLLLSEVYQRLKLDKKSERVSDCGSFLRFAHELDLDTGSFSDKGKLHYANFCRDRLCPTCSWRKGLKLYSQISRCIPEIVKDYKCLFLTLTVPNCSEQDFSKTIDRLMFAWNRLTKYKKFKTVIKGFFRILEVTRNKDNGSLHPHFHIILVVSKSYGKHQETYFTRDEFLELWRKAYQDETCKYDPLYARNDGSYDVRYCVRGICFLPSRVPRKEPCFYPFTRFISQKTCPLWRSIQRNIPKVKTRRCRRRNLRPCTHRRYCLKNCSSFNLFLWLGLWLLQTYRFLYRLSIRQERGDLMKCECSLKEFVKRYPVYASAFSNMVSDPDYIAKFKVDKNGKLEFLEVGYKEDIWAIDNMR